MNSLGKIPLGYSIKKNGCGEEIAFMSWGGAKSPCPGGTENPCFCPGG